MAILSNVNGKFAVDSTGAIQFSGQTGTSGYVLKSNGNAAPTWVDGSTVIGGPYLPLAGGILTGATSTASGISFTVGGTLTVNDNISTSADKRVSVGAWDNSAFTGGNAQGFSVQGVTPGLFILETDQTNKKSYLAMSGGGMYLGGSINFLALDTDGARALTLDSSQNATFSGSIIFSDNSYQAAYSIRRNASAIIFSGGTSGYYFNRHNNSVTDVYINGSGNVGIGVTDPKNQLNIFSGTDTMMGFWGSSTYSAMQSVNLANTVLKDMRFDFDEAFFIGNAVGIGTTSPSQKLHVVGKSLFTDDIQLTQTSPRIDYGNTTAGALRFFSVDANSEKMRITSAGDVGIGTTLPAAKLDIGDGDFKQLKIIGANRLCVFRFQNAQSNFNNPDIVLFSNTTATGSYPQVSVHIKMHGRGFSANYSQFTEALATVELSTALIGLRSSIINHTTLGSAVSAGAFSISGTSLRFTPNRQTNYDTFSIEVNINSISVTYDT